jgi:hypothetical protein
MFADFMHVFATMFAAGHLFLGTLRPWRLGNHNSIAKCPTHADRLYKAPNQRDMLVYLHDRRILQNNGCKLE